MASIRKKIVVVGDGACGKTCLLRVFSEGNYVVDYCPCVLPIFVKHVEVDGKMIELVICDTPGQEDYDRTRPLYYPDTDVILICFSVDEPDSLKSVTEKWHPEVTHFCKRVPIVLVGTRTDLRDDQSTIRNLARHGQKIVGKDQGKALADQIGALDYVECSAITNIGVSEVFQTAAQHVLNAKDDGRKGGKHGGKVCIIC